jgi:hypothetical protein
VESALGTSKYPPLSTAGFFGTRITVATDVGTFVGAKGELGPPLVTAPSAGGEVLEGERILRVGSG